MGVCYGLFCDDCKEWVDLGKLGKRVDECVSRWRPPTAEEAEPNGWIYGQALWFYVRHVGHPVRQMTDCSDEWYQHDYKQPPARGGE